MGSENEVTQRHSDSPRATRIRRWLRIAGAILAVWGLTGSLLFLVLDIAPGEAHAYAAVNLIPSVTVLVLGILLLALGRLRRGAGQRESLERAMSAEVGASLAGTVILGTAAITFLMTTVGTGASRLYEFTESNVFCGESCHSVMEPEWVAFQDGPHSRLDCVECHIGPNVDSNVAYKFNGLRQMLAVATGNVERPISTPVHNLRPAREICEHCHWSGRFIDYRESTHAYFLADEENTRVNVRLLTKVGGGSRGLTEGSGIHYHMNVASRVDYVARDPQRQQIPWVRVTHADGSVTEYQDGDDPLEDAERDALGVRTMDCLDCHNRPAHRFEAPVVTVNAALASGAISRNLPFIKAQSVAALDAGYATRAEAFAGIGDRLTAYYEDEYPELAEERRGELDGSIEAIRAIYGRHFFPEMKANWLAHPDNVGHRDSPGCFRCHNDRMESAEGTPIATACNSCHVILAQGEDVVKIETDGAVGMTFYHPNDDYFDEYTECTDCHSGGADLYE